MFKKKIWYAWEQRKVSELADETYGGGTPKTSIEEYWNGTIPWIQSSDITEHDVNSFNPKKFISEEAVNKSATKLVPENSIAIVTRVGVGKLVIMPFPYATSQDFLSLSKLNSDVPFTAYLLYKKMQNESYAVQGTSIKGITKEELLSKEVMIPQLEEQKKIGAYFSELDYLITLHQQKPENFKISRNLCLKHYLYRGEKRKMAKLNLFYGTPDKIVVPIYGKGEEKHDYGKGFYLTASIDLEKEWAVCRPNEENGYVHQYEFDADGLKILDFQEKGILANSDANK